MPLPAPTAEREPLHERRVVMTGYARKDGLFDIEGWLTDTKTYPLPTLDGPPLAPGQPVHGMGLRLTIDTAYMIHDVAATMDQWPFRICPEVLPNFSRLIGVQMTSGFRKKVDELLGATNGCTHLIALINQLSTVAYQTIQARQGLPPRERSNTPPRQMNSCYGWSQSGPAMHHMYPEFATPPSPKR
jgi:hypothetical protein